MKRNLGNGERVLWAGLIGCLLMIPAAATAQSGIVSDEFNGAALDTALWEVVDPVGDVTVELNGTQLQIDIPADVEHELFEPTNTAPRVMQDINDADFEVEVKFDSEVTQQFQTQGILVQEDADSYIRFDVYSDGAAVNLFSVVLDDGAESFQISQVVALSAPIWLRVQRTGNVWEFSYSDNGTDFTAGQAGPPGDKQSFFEYELTVAQVGIWAGTTSNAGADPPAFSMLADYFRNIGEAAVDSDGDGVNDPQDNCPNTANPNQEDADNDGIGDVCDDDRDGDGVTNAQDNCPDEPNPTQADSDNDGIGDPCDPDAAADSDGDGVFDFQDNCPDTSNTNQADMDNDGIGDVCDNDRDGDGVPNNQDNCPNTSNADQVDLDNDGIGDICDPDQIVDADGDLIPDSDDNCPNTVNSTQVDSDGDGLGDACDSCPNDAENDFDGDGVCGDVDNCPSVSNSNQADSDGDGVGDVCDTDGQPATDADGDTVTDDQDNCPNAPNPGQEDADGDGLGDACDDTPQPPFRLFPFCGFGMLQGAMGAMLGLMLLGHRRRRI